MYLTRSEGTLMYMQTTPPTFPHRIAALLDRLDPTPGACGIADCIHHHPPHTSHLVVAGHGQA
jgi:hypothetical protein